MTTFMHAYSGETFDGRGSYNVQPSTPDPQVTGASFDFCTVCAEFELRNAVPQGNSRNCFVSSDDACQIMAKLPDIVKAEDQRGCQ